MGCRGTYRTGGGGGGGSGGGGGGGTAGEQVSLGALDVSESSRTGYSHKKKRGILALYLDPEWLLVSPEEPQ